MKTCTTCGCEKPPTEFYSGRGDCKACKRSKTNAYRSTRVAYYAEKARAWELANPEKKRSRQRANYSKDVYAARERVKAQYQKHKVRKLAQNKAYTKANPPNPELVSLKNRIRYLKDEAAARQRTKDFAKANPAYYAYKAAERRAHTKMATPKWLTAVEKEAIKKMFYDAANRDTPHEVDHIIPLKGKAVCGLHVPWNLQVIPESENRCKSNKLMESL